jgi:Na+-transporting methylmalonyl-CoA/oxaloacetate decarboxylase gamma subunit
MSSTAVASIVILLLAVGVQLLVLILLFHATKALEKMAKSSEKQCDILEELVKSKSKIESPEEQKLKTAEFLNKLTNK